MREAGIRNVFNGVSLEELGNIIQGGGQRERIPLHR